MPVLLNLTGVRFGKLQVLSRVPHKPCTKTAWLCQCACGETTVATTRDLRKGDTKSCGCLKLLAGDQTATHRMSNSRTYVSWASMINRCTNKNGQHYRHYGGRGISICDSWLSFENFLADMGERPEGRSIDRIDNEGNYEPGNCRWATQKQQMNNTRRNRKNRREEAGDRAQALLTAAE